MILCPVDFSPSTLPLVAYAAMLAHATGASIELLHVLESSAVAPAMSREPLETGARTRLSQLATDPSLTGIDVQLTIRVGTPEQVIVAHAGEQAAELIVIGAHGTTGLTRFLMGSTAEGVLRAAPCPTMLITLRPNALAPAQAA